MENHLVQRGTSFKPEPIIISELQLNAVVRGWLFAVDVQTRPDKNGKSFRQLRLRDRRGNEITGYYFDPLGTEAYIALEDLVYYSMWEIQCFRIQGDSKPLMRLLTFIPLLRGLKILWFSPRSQNKPEKLQIQFPN